MDTVWWLVIVVAFLLSFVGLIYPIIPSVLMIWVGAIIYHFLINAEMLTWWTWGSFLVFTMILFVIDYIANHFFVKKYGATKSGLRAATIGLIVGSFIFPPFGILIIPFSLVLITELVQKKPFNEAGKVALGTLIAFLSSTFAKACIQLTLIVVFLLDVFI
ncbi:DUF456 domain-containing protein [Halalkalibacter urbisdiaboli]|uniref:DUF456 domain-containing protein n=1 Tax=Halalkalibacter urbisdiaboli TaxID=1960589 RepID=UPI000B451494|nr:DUF456 domain-containing protein [Halalkalibacter urbisdiaboli]